MKPFLLILLPGLFASVTAPAAETLNQRSQNTVVLDETGVKNLRIETVEVEEATFEDTVFSLGHLEVLPGKKAIVSSRIEGRAFSVLVIPHTEVDAGAEVAWVESRQPGDPPPVVKLEAPISGLISKVNIAPGQPVSPNDELIEIVDLSTVEAVANVPQQLAGRVKLGQKAYIKVPALPDKVFEAKIVHMAAIADETSGTIEAAFHVPNPDRTLRPGMRAEFNIVLSTRENVTSVPRSAIQGSAQDRFVYVKDFELENAFVKVPVVVGTMNDRYAEVLSGLLPGDEVVTHGAYSLSFAGASSISLKEALDAAHGHEHAADGSELKPGQKAGGHDDDGDHDHAEDGHGGASPVWMYVSGVLFVLLLISLMTRKSSAPAEENGPAANPAQPKEDEKPC